MLARISGKLEQQAMAFPGEVEILIEVDAREKSTGTKRNLLYQKAQGKYVCSVDDDDDVSDSYVADILEAVKGDPDAVALNGTMTTNGRNLVTWDISRLHPYCTVHKPGGKVHYLRYHNHLSPIRREIAIQYPFPDMSFKEDYAFATAIHNAKAIRTEAKVIRPAYHYKYIEKK